MTTPQPGEITAAAIAIHDAECPDRKCSGSALGAAYRLATVALNAAGPLMHERCGTEIRAALKLIAGKDKRITELENALHAHAPDHDLLRDEA